MRGYTGAKIAQWAEGPAFQADVALYFISLRATLDLIGKVDQLPTVKGLDRREELKNVILTDISGTVIPEELKPLNAPVGYGSIKASSRFIDPVTGCFKQW